MLDIMAFHSSSIFVNNVGYPIYEIVKTTTHPKQIIKKFLNIEALSYINLRKHIPSTTPIIFARDELNIISANIFIILKSINKRDNLDL